MTDNQMILILLAGILLLVFFVWVGVTIVQTCDQVKKYIKRQEAKDNEQLTP